MEEAAVSVVTPAPSTGALVEVKNLSHLYHKGGAGDLLVLDDTNLCLKENEIVGLLGRSGCGKSTLLRISLASCRRARVRSQSTASR